MRLYSGIVPVLRAFGHPQGLDVFALVGVLNHTSLAAVISSVGQASNQHTARKRIHGVGTHDPPGVFHESVESFKELRLGRIGGDIEDKNLTIVEPAHPQIAPVIGETAVVSFVATADRNTGEDFSILLSLLRIGTKGDEFVRAVADSFSSQSPDIHEILLAGDLWQIGGLASLIRENCRLLSRQKS